MKGNGAQQIRQGARRNRVRGETRLSPPEFVPTLSLGHKFRFSSGAAGFSAQSITRSMLLNLVTMATTTTNQFRVFEAIKLNRVSMWGQPPALAGAPTSVAVEWVGTNSPSTIHSDSAVGVRPAYLSSRPPPQSSNIWWSISGMGETDELMRLSGPAGTIIDIDVTLRLVDDEAAVAGESGTGAASTVGTVYWNYLDGFASKKLAPVGGVRTLP